MTALIEPDLTVFARGNISCADDAIGPLLANRIRLLRNPCLALIEDNCFRTDHASNICPSAPVLFIHASVEIDRGIVLQKLSPEPDLVKTLSPAALLHLFELTLQTPAPDAYQLHVAGSNFEPGAELSDEGRRAVDAAWRFLRRLFAEPCERWLEALELASVEALPGRA